MKDILLKFLNIFKILIIIYITGMLIISIDGLTFSKNKKETKYAIVYGSKVKQNGEVSERLKARLDKSIELFNNKEIKLIIVSGGLGETGLNEAIIMKKYLINNGIKLPFILIDKKGNTTADTSKNSYNIVKRRGDYPNIGVIGVSQFFHCSRVKLSLKKSGFSNVYCESPEYFEYRDFYSLIREIPAYVKYFFIGFDDIEINKQDLEKIGEKVLEKIKK